MAVNTVASSTASNTAIQQATPARQPEPVKADKPAERIEQPPPPPPQAATAPTVNTSGQRIGTTISTSA